MSDARSQFEAQIREVLRDELPEILDEIPWDDAPSMRWADGGDVPPEIVRGWLSAAVIRDDPEPTAEQRAQAQLFDESSRQALSAWIEKVLASLDRPAPALSEERLAQLREQAESAAALARKFGRGGTDPEERFRQLVELYGGESRPVAAFRGLLAVADPCRTAFTI